SSSRILWPSAPRNGWRSACIARDRSAKSRDSTNPRTPVERARARRPSTGMETAMTDEATTQTNPPPGWSNAPPDEGIGASEPPPEDIDMSVPGWSNTEPPEPPPRAATGAPAATPGSWTPAGATPPATNNDLGAITASPTTVWTIGQYIVCADASEAYWNGAAWAVGRAS